MQSVAAATEELSASVSDISQRVTQSTNIVSKTVQKAHQTDLMHGEITRFLDHICAA